LLVGSGECAARRGGVSWGGMWWIRLGGRCRWRWPRLPAFCLSPIYGWMDGGGGWAEEEKIELLAA
jgi:hypothetical protein